MQPRPRVKPMFFYVNAARTCGHVTCLLDILNVHELYERQKPAAASLLDCILSRFLRHWVHDM
jgi:hypothetical protein